MNSLDELEALNKAKKIFDKYALASDLHVLGQDYFVTTQENLYHIIRDVAELFEKEHPLWNFPKFPDNGSSGEVAKK